MDNHVEVTIKEIVERAVVRALSASTNRWLSPAQTAEYTSISRQQLALWRMHNEGIPFARVSQKLIRYDRLVIDQFMEAHRVAGGAS